MAEELKHLLERIRKEGVEVADKEATEIKEQATAEAEKILEEARAKAKAMVEDAGKEAEAHARRGRQTLEQAARDVVLIVGESVSKLFEELTTRRVEQALDDAAMREILVAVIQAYVKDNESRKLQVLVSEEQQEKLAQTVIGELGKAVTEGVTIEGDDRILSGFRVTIADAHVEHDFTGAAIAEALCELLRPHLAEIVRAALPTEKDGE